MTSPALDAAPDTRAPETALSQSHARAAEELGLDALTADEARAALARFEADDEDDGPMVSRAEAALRTVIAQVAERDSLRATLRERDEEIARLRAAFARGVEAMREAAALACCDAASDLAVAQNSPDYEECIHEVIGRGLCARCNAALDACRRIRALVVNP